MDEKIIDVPAPLVVTPSMDNNKQKKGSVPLPSVEEVFKWAPFQLLLPSFKKNKSRFQKLLPSVQAVLGWALLAAGCVAVTLGFSIVMAFADIHISSTTSSQTSTILQVPDLTPAQEVEVDSFADGFLWLTVPQAAAATVGLLLPRRRAGIRWTLALVAVVSATVAHYMNARMALVFIAANPGVVAYTIYAIDLLGLGLALCIDLLGLISLLIGGRDPRKLYKYQLAHCKDHPHKKEPQPRAAAAPSCPPPPTPV
ncbi:hypothetical protein EJB05_02211 [Eragrostis curvula]|uniref:Uncharacterized protein n=1 Tax=Eragrostis curvula TaxID=38414 RepID=A0A5J9WU22_9POAL|nr:hypothetical protein EJB05_02211 [Eragrostis curvula]